jgi:hypothetical protein
MSLLLRQTRLPLFRTRKATSTIRTGFGRFTIMSSWRIQLFEKLMSAVFRAEDDDYRWHWRIHVGLWAAASAARLEGDFIECGVNRGFLSSAIMDYLDWDSLGKHFYLLDTFRGLDERFVSPADRASGAAEKNEKSLASGFYVQGTEEVRANFSQWKNVSLIEGSIP